MVLMPAYEDYYALVKLVPMKKSLESTHDWIHSDLFCKTIIRKLVGIENNKNLRLFSTLSIIYSSAHWYKGGLSKFTGFNQECYDFQRAE